MRKLIISLITTIILSASEPESFTRYGKMGILYDTGILKYGGDLNWRANNPGNIKDSPFTRDNGAIGEYKGFAVFPNLSTGYSAMVKLLKGGKYKNEKVQNFISRYSPKEDKNDTKKYKKYIKRYMSYVKNKKLGELSDKEIIHLIYIVSLYEGMHAGKIYKAKSK